MQRSTTTCIAVTVAMTLMGSTARVGVAQDRPVELGQGDLEALTGESASPLQITGFGVGSYTLDARTRDNSFQAGKVALSAFREVNDYLWFFGQLTTALESGDGAAGEVATSTEIDNLLVSATMPGATNVNVSFGKFDVPLGFERDDEPLNLQPSTSFNYELARPGKMVGLVGRWSLTPRLDITAIAGNGWDSQIDPNHGKTGALRIGALPSEHVSFGIGGAYGPEGESGETNQRYLVNFDYALQPSPRIIVAGEANLGGDRAVLQGGESATWMGGTLTVFVQPKRHLGITFRGEVFDDHDGARTGQIQTLQSYTVAPVIFLGLGREGIFANVEHTTFRIPRFQLRAEGRLNRSNVPFFDTQAGLRTWNVEYTIQLVTVF